MDGEIVAFQGGHTSFSRLQGRIGLTDPAAARRSGIAVYLYLFDVLHIGGEDTTALPLRQRKARLRRGLDWRDPLRLTTHRNRHGERFLSARPRLGGDRMATSEASGCGVTAGRGAMTSCRRRRPERRRCEEVGRP